MCLQICLLPSPLPPGQCLRSQLFTPRGPFPPKATSSSCKISSVSKPLLPHAASTWWSRQSKESPPVLKTPRTAQTTPGWSPRTFRLYPVKSQEQGLLGLLWVEEGCVGRGLIDRLPLDDWLNPTPAQTPSSQPCLALFSWLPARLALPGDSITQTLSHWLSSQACRGPWGQPFR